MTGLVGHASGVNVERGRRGWWRWCAFHGPHTLSGNTRTVDGAQERAELALAELKRRHSETPTR